MLAQHLARLLKVDPNDLNNNNNNRRNNNNKPRTAPPVIEVICVAPSSPLATDPVPNATDTGPPFVPTSTATTITGGAAPGESSSQDTTPPATVSNPQSKHSIISPTLSPALTPRQHSDTSGLHPHHHHHIHRGKENGFNDNASLASSISAITPRLEDKQTATLTFRDLTYRVEIGKGPVKKVRDVLKGVCGAAQAGRLVAIMGPSGAGKTCLLNALADRLPTTNNGSLSGEILVNGLQREDTFQRMVGFVTQDDVFFSNLTVMETLLFAAKLKLPHTNDVAIEEIVNAVINELSLTQAANTRIGSAMVRGVSGGERKRVNIGTALLSTIPILFLDEPTTNLDAFQAMNVMTTLRAVARNGRTVLSTIHQPRSSIYQLFDDLFLLSEGHVMYFGPACDAVAYFSGLRFQCPEFYNPADFFMDLIAIDRRNAVLQSESAARVDTLATSFRESSGWAETLLRHEDLKNKPGYDAGSFYLGYMASFGRQLQLLSRRSFHQVLRDSMSLKINLFMNVFFGLLLGFLYFQMGYSQTNIQDRRGLVFFVIIHCSFGLIAAVQGAFTVEKGIIAHEREARLYRISAYYIAKVISEIPIRAVMPLLYSVLVYWISGLKVEFAAFVLFVFILIVVVLCATSLGLFISAIAPSVPVSMALGPVAMTMSLLFGGFYANRDTIPAALRWIEWLSYVRYAYEALAINEFMGTQFSCAAATPSPSTTTWALPASFNSSAYSCLCPSTNDTFCSLPTNTSLWFNPSLASSSGSASLSLAGAGGGGACALNGEDVLVQLSLEHSYGVLWRNVGLLLVLTVVFHWCAYWALRKQSAKKRVALPQEARNNKHGHKSKIKVSSGVIQVQSGST